MIKKVITINMGQKHKHGAGNPNEAEDKPGQIRQIILITA